MATREAEPLRELEKAIACAREMATAARAMVASVEYEKVHFLVGRRFVSANLHPLQFFHLVEHIDHEDAAGAVIRLYERLSPLLTCRHQWTDLKRTTDLHTEAVVGNPTDAAARPQICRSCTAYTLADAKNSPPLVGMFQD